MSCNLSYYREKGLLKPNTVVIYDDKKNKHQSIEAYYIDENLDPKFEGYGSTEREALIDLRKSIENSLDELMGILNTLSTDLPIKLL